VSAVAVEPAMQKAIATAARPTMFRIFNGDLRFE
jgi:hypothetical protein